VKGMILAAGLGMRMRPLTSLRAKPALPVMNRPLLHWTLEKLAAVGIREVFINTHHLPASVRRAVGDGAGLGVRVHYSHERTILGTGGGPKKLRRQLGDEPLLLVNGDVLFGFDLKALVARHRKMRAEATLGLIPSPDPKRYSPVVMGREGRIASIAGRPRPRRGRPWLFTGIQVLEARLLDRLPKGTSDTVRDLYIPLLDEGATVAGVPLRGAWYDFGSPPLYLESQLALLRSGFGGSRGGRLVHTTAHVHPRARIASAVVGAGSTVGEDARVEQCVVWERARIGAGARVRRAIVVAGARVRDGQDAVDVIVLPEKGGRSRMVPLVEGRK
jgi:mannose-1-phosphate guanylyltransferase